MYSEIDFTFYKLAKLTLRFINSVFQDEIEIFDIIFLLPINTPVSVHSIKKNVKFRVKPRSPSLLIDINI